MENNLPKIKEEGIFTKIKNWFKSRFGIDKVEYDMPSNNITEQKDFKDDIIVQDKVDYEKLNQVLKLNGIVTSRDPKEYSLEETVNAQRELSNTIKELEQSNSDTVIEAVKRKISVLYDVSEEFTQQHPELIEVILEKVKKNGNLLMHVNQKLQDDYPNIAMEAIINNEMAKECLSKNLKNNPEFWNKLEETKQQREEEKLQNTIDSENRVIE